jgi:Putative auto-transporter adhesin, head GIN domain
MLTALAACGPPDERPDCFKPAGRTATDSRVLAPFQQIVVRDNIRLVIAADGGKTYRADVTAGRNLLRQLHTTVRPMGKPGQFELVLDNANRCNWVRDQTRPLTITVHVPDSAARQRLTIVHEGEEPIRTAAPLTRLDSLFMFTTNIGDIDMDVESIYLWLGAYEYGDIKLRGRTRDLRCTASAIGQLRAENLDCEYAYVVSDRDAEVHVRASRDIGITLRGRANGYWYGSPEGTTFRASSSGKIIRGGE